MSRRRIVIEVAFDVDDFLAGASWCIGTVTTQYVDEHLRSKIERRIATDTAWLNASARYLRLAGVTVARPNATPRTVTTVTIEPDNGTGAPICTHVVFDEASAYQKLRERYPEVAELRDDEIKEALADHDIYVQIEEHPLP